MTDNHESHRSSRCMSTNGGAWPMVGEDALQATWGGFESHHLHMTARELRKKYDGYILAQTDFLPDSKYIKYSVEWLDTGVKLGERFIIAINKNQWISTSRLKRVVL